MKNSKIQNTGKTNAEILDVYSAIWGEDYEGFLAETNADDTAETKNRFKTAQTNKKSLNSKGFTDSQICDMVA